MGGILVVVLILLGIYVVISASMGIINLLFTLLIWAVIGWLAGQLIRGRGYGAVINILLGIGGGIIGSIVFTVLGLGIGGGIIGNILAGVVGAVILIFAGRALRSQN